MQEVLRCLLQKNNIIDSTIINVQGGILWRTKILALLLDCWKMQKEFKRNGFEKSSLNVICKNAGITTGALYKRFSTKEDLFNSLVEKPANRLKEFLDKEHSAYKKLPKEEQINCVFRNWENEDGFIGLIYEYKEEFLMILNLSGGTKYEFYFDEISKIITDATMQFIRTNNKSDVDEFILYELVHILVSSYIKGILVPLSQNMNLNEANIYIQHVKKFFYAGWKDLLRI